VSVGLDKTTVVVFEVDTRADDIGDGNNIIGCLDLSSSFLYPSLLS
jgi:hypothetical protein